MALQQKIHNVFKLANNKNKIILKHIVKFSDKKVVSYKD